VVVTAVVALGGAAGSGQPPGQKAPPRPLPEDIVAAWKKAGAQVGWMRIEKRSVTLTSSGAKEGKAGDVPVFYFGFFSWKDGLLAGLPGPERPFGLSLAGTTISDAGLKELAGLKQLQMLSLDRT